MPETWLREEDKPSCHALCPPRRRSAPVTDVLQWLQCFAALVGMLSQCFPAVVPELMDYQAPIIKCSRDFDGLAWAQYDRAYRRQAAQTKDLSLGSIRHYNSLCFAGKAKHGVTCVHCLSNGHVSEARPDNPTRAYVPVWYAGRLATGAPTPQLPTQQTKVCHLFNAYSTLQKSHCDCL